MQRCCWRRSDDLVRRLDERHRDGRVCPQQAAQPPLSPPRAAATDPATRSYGAYLKQNSDAITAIAPTIWHLAQDSQSLTADDAIMAATAKLKKQSGVRVIPTVFDNESYNQGTLKPRLLKLFANPHKFINAIVNASVFYDFDGVNLDFEPRWKASPSDRAGLLKFVNELSDAMHKVGKVVSIDAAPCVNPSWQGVKWQNNCMW